MVKHGGSDVSVMTAWQQLFGLTIMTQMPSMAMEHHNEAPRPSQCMQFGNTMFTPAENSDNTIFFDDTAATFIVFNQPMQNYSDDQSVATVNEVVMASHQPSPPSQDSAVLPSVLSGLEPVRMEGFAKCQELWQNQCHSVSSMEGTRCTTWHH
jgi:hypothetical protein